jgi:hypothetical protein
MEKLPRGWGVLADDLLGSVYAAAALYVIYAVMDVFWSGSPVRPYIINV